MTLISRHKIICDAVAATLLEDSELEAFKFLVRKKARHRDKPWEPGAYVCPGSAYAPAHENQLDMISFDVVVVVVHPTDADLEDGLADHLAVIERVEDIFRFKSGGRMPGTMLEEITSTDPDSIMSLVKCDSRPQSRFLDQAFEAGFDVSSCTIRVDVRIPRRTVSNL
jgi:hypothetical protein